MPSVPCCKVPGQLNAGAAGFTCTVTSTVLEEEAEHWCVPSFNVMVAVAV